MNGVRKWSQGIRKSLHAYICRSSCDQLGTKLHAVCVLQVCCAAHAEGEGLQDTPTSSGTQLSVLSRYACVYHCNSVTICMLWGLL